MGKLLPLKAPASKRIEGHSNPSGLATHLQVRKAKASHRNLTAGTWKYSPTGKRRNIYRKQTTVFFLVPAVSFPGCIRSWELPKAHPHPHHLLIFLSLSKLPNAAAEDHCCAKATPWKRRMMKTSRYLGWRGQHFTAERAGGRKREVGNYMPKDTLAASSKKKKPYLVEAPTSDLARSDITK